MSTQKAGTKVPESLDSPQTDSFSPHLGANQRYGLRIEQWVIEKLTQKGYTPTIPTNFSETACDAWIDGLCIEIKGARRTKRTAVLASGEVKTYYRYQWSISPCHRQEYALILVAETPGRKRICFVVPGSQVGERTHLQITSHPLKYQGWLAQYREKWDVIDYLASQVYRGNGPMFENWEGSKGRVSV